MFDFYDSWPQTNLFTMESEWLTQSITLILSKYDVLDFVGSIFPAVAAWFISSSSGRSLCTITCGQWAKEPSVNPESQNHTLFSFNLRN